MLCLNFAGCKSGSDVANIVPDSKPPAQIAPEPDTNVFTSAQLKQLNRNADAAQVNTPADLTQVPQPISGNDTYTALQDSSLEIKPPENTTITEQPVPGLSQTDQDAVGAVVNIPVLKKPGMADQLISVNFDQVDVRTMLKTIGDITGINFVVDDSVHGKVTVMSPTKIRLGDLYNVLQSVLEVKGYAAVPSGQIVKIIPRAQAAKQDLDVRVGADPAKIPLGDFLVTQIMPIRYADAAEVVQIVRPRLAKDAQMAAYPRTNSILITDTSSNIHHIAEIIKKLDVTGSQRQTTVIALKYASARELSEQISQILEKTQTAIQPTGHARGTSRIAADIKIIPYDRTNSIVVVANARNTDTVKSLVRQLDIRRPSETNNIHVVYLKNAPAKQIAESLTNALANLRITTTPEAGRQVNVTADESTNALIITAEQQDFEIIRQIIEKLDIAQKQVAVEMLIVEVSESSLKEIGIDWATLDDAVAGSVRVFGSTNFGPRVDYLSGDLEGLAVGTFKKSGSDTLIGPIMHALEKTSGVNILSTPHITTSNHQKARIVVGENVPYVMQSRVTETDPSTPTVIKTFEYKDVGISLEITPHIGQGQLVRLEISSQFTKLIETLTASSSDTPTTAKREAQTVVSMNSGSTVVIGGLIRDDKVTIVKKIPLLGDLPLLGPLFRFQRDQLQKTNLLIFITPKILAGPQDMEQATENKKRQMMPELKKLDKNVGPG